MKINKRAKAVWSKQGILEDNQNLLFTGLYSVKKAAQHHGWNTNPPLQPGAHFPLTFWVTHTSTHQKALIVAWTHTWSFYSNTPFHSRRLYTLVKSKSTLLYTPNLHVKVDLWRFQGFLFTC